MASIHRDGRNGSWLARWRHPNGGSRSKSFRRKVDAERFLSQLTAELHRGTYIDPTAGKMTVAAFATVWAEGLAHLKPSTAARYRGIVEGHIVPRWAGWRLAGVAHSDVSRWVADMSAAGLSASSVRHVHRVFSLVMDAAVQDNRIARNPAAAVRLPRQHRAEPRFLTVEELNKLLDASGSDWLPIAVLALTGLRFGELAALRVGRVDHARRRLIVTESATEVAGTLVWSAPKTHQHRSVPFPASLDAPLQRACAGKSRDELVFTAPEGGPLRYRNWRSRVYDPAVRAAGLDNVRPHDLRHTAASLAVQAGANVKAVQRMLGHASAAMTLDVYAGLFSEHLDSVGTAMDTVAQGLALQLRYTGPRRPSGEVAGADPDAVTWTDMGGPGGA